jgi:DNA-binding response OmpR family regulator
MFVKTEQSNLDGVDVLLVEDDPLLATSLARNLIRVGAEVTIAGTLEAAFAQVRRKKWDVIVLDQMLPDGDGLDVIDDLDTLPERPAVVAVSANLQDSRRSLMLQGSGALLLPKPFSSKELVVAIARALGRRDSEHRALSRSASNTGESGAVTTQLVFGRIALNLVSQTVLVEDDLVELPPAQFRILATLLSNVGRAFSVRELADGALRGTHQDGTVNIRFQIHGLRRSLGAQGALIETAAGGYGIGLSLQRQDDVAVFSRLTRR